MKPPAWMPLELVLIGEAFARRLKMPIGDFWAVLFRKKPAPPGWAAAWTDAFEPLTTEAEFGTLDTMDATEISPARRGRPSTRPRHPFVAMLKKRRLTVAEVAHTVKRSPSTVKAWYKPAGDDFRPIPRAIAESIRELYGVPLSAWTRIAD